MSDSTLTTFINDNLLDFLGMTDGTTTAYLLALAKKSKSEQSLMESLLDADLPNSEKTKRFCASLYARASAMGSKSSSNGSLAAAQAQGRQTAAREAAHLAAKNRTFGILYDEDADEDIQAEEDLRSVYLNLNEQNDLQKRSKKGKKDKNESTVSEEERRRQEMDDDLKERDEFAKRILQKDRDTTKQLAKGAKRDRDRDMKRELSEDELGRYVPTLREKSRQEYLAKREKQQLELQKRYIEDEEFLYEESERNKAERKKLEAQKQVLDLASKRAKAEEKQDAYHLPDSYVTEEGKLDKDKQMALLTKRYQVEHKAKSDQEVWEGEQTKKASLRMKGGSDSGQVGEGFQDKEYEYVFEDQIDFITTELLEGRDVRSLIPKKKTKDEILLEEEEAQASEFEKIQIGRKKLPVYPYRSQLVQAVRDHQILIIVGETGSGKTTQIMQYLFEEGLAGDVSGKQRNRNATNEGNRLRESNRDMEKYTDKNKSRDGNRGKDKDRGQDKGRDGDRGVGSYKGRSRHNVDASEEVRHDANGGDMQRDEVMADDGPVIKKLGCTQPRRVAAMSVAARVAVEKGVKLGREVGYSIRFEDCTSEKTVIKYMTDGMLLREFLGEPDLKSYAAIMIDEAHERTLHTDILFGLIKDIARFRPDLKLLISSATLDAEKFSDYFDMAPVFQIPGRMYPVTTYYTKAPEADYRDACVVTVLHIHTTQPAGDILVFLPGQDDIEACEEAINERMRGLGSKVGDSIGDLLVLPIYSSLPTDMQARIFEETPKGCRKVVLATNIAETSLTINGIIFVIDPGFAKQKSYNPRSGMDSLLVAPISKASANQRMGRAGRVAPGKCFRLYTAHAFMNELEENTVPEIQRTNLGNVVLLLKSLGINDLIHFDFMDPPPAETLRRALEQLYALGALNDRGELTKLGRRMAELPLDPMLSKMLIQSESYECTEQVLTVCAMLNVGSAVMFRPKDKAVHADNAHKNFWDIKGDHLTLMKIYDDWQDADYSKDWCHESFIQHRSMQRARDVREQLVNMLARVEVQPVSSGDDVKIRKAITSGFFYHTAKLDSTGSYKTVKQKMAVSIHPSSCLLKENPKWVVYHELVKTSKEFMRTCIEVEPQWLTELAPHYYQLQDVADTSKHKKAKAIGKAANT